MRISIVTLAYNQGKFVEEAINSVLSQNYPDLEYIVVEPGSTDGTREILARYERKINSLILTPDTGPGDGLNKGFAEATGEIFGFLNADDILMPGALERVRQVFEQSRDAQIVSGHMWIIDEAGRKIRRSYTDPFNAVAYAYQVCTICQQSTFIRAAAFRGAGGFNAENRVAWDAELFLNVLNDTKSLAIIDELLSGFRVYSSSITGSRKNLDVHKKYFDTRFETVMGRPWNRWDDAVRLAFYIRKYALNPRSLYERLARGAIIKGEIAPKY